MYKKKFLIVFTIVIVFLSMLVNAKEPKTINDDSYNKQYATNFYRLTLAEIALTRNQYNDALALYINLSENTNNEKIKAQAIELAIAMQAPAVAQNILNKWLKTAPKNTLANLYQVKYLMAKKDFSAATKLLEKLQYNKEYHDDIIFLKSLIAFEERKLPEALAFASDLHDSKYNDQAMYFIGQIYEMQNKHDLAIKQYAEVKSGKYYFQAKLSQAILLMQKGLYKKSLQIVTPLKPETKIHAVTKSILLGNIYLAMDDNVNAIKVLSYGLVHDPGNMRLLFLRGVAYANLGKINPAEEDLNEVLAKNANDPDALNALGYTLANLTNRYSEAHAILSKAFKLQPKSAAVMDSLGWVLFKMGKHNEALNYLEKAYALVPENAIGAHYAVVLNASGKIKKAKAIIKHIKKQNHVSIEVMDILDKYELK